MRKLYLLIILFINCQLLFSQNDNFINKQRAFKEFSERNPKYAYVYLYLTKGGKEKKIYKYFYSDIDSAFKVIYSNEQNETFRDTILKKDILFDYLDSNWHSIKFLRNNYNNPDFRKYFDDENYLMKQIGIRYNDLHYNHFIPKSSDEIAKIKNDKIKDAFLIINAIEGFFINIFNK